MGIDMGSTPQTDRPTDDETTPAHPRGWGLVGFRLASLDGHVIAVETYDTEARRYLLRDIQTGHQWIISAETLHREINDDITDIISADDDPRGWIWGGRSGPGRLE